MKCNKVSLYTLEHPLTGEIRYIGKTIQELKYRLSSHISKAKNDGRKSHVYCWIRGLLNENLTPTIKLIDIIEEKDWIEEEKFYISYFKYLGVDLTNKHEGGGREYIPTRKNDKSFNLFTLDGELIGTWGSRKEFCEINNIKPTTLGEAIRHNRIVLKKYIARNVEDSFFNKRIK